MSSLKAWAIAGVLLLAAFCAAMVASYRSGRAAERSSSRSALLRADSAKTDSLERLRKERGAIAAAAVVVSRQRDSARVALDREIDASRRRVSVTGPTTIVIRDTSSGQTMEAEVPREVVERMQKDSVAIDSLRSDVRQSSGTIDDLRLLLSADSALFRTKDSTIAHLKIEQPKPPLLDRVLAKVTVPAAKVAIVGGVAWGVVQIGKNLLRKK